MTLQSVPFQMTVGTPGVGTLSTDANGPNTTAPDDARILYVRRVPCAGSVPASIMGAIYDGAGKTITITPWVFDTETDMWWPAGPAVTITGVTPAKVVSMVNIDNCAFFLQITANTNTSSVGFQYGP